MEPDYYSKLRQLESDEPDLTVLYLCGPDIPHGDWGKLGILIGRNTNLKSLTLDNCNGNEGKEYFEKLFHGIACSASIEIIMFFDCQLFDGEVFNLLVPMFKRNDGICLEISYRPGCCALRPSCVQSLASALSEFHSLKEFELAWCSINDDAASLQLIRSLECHHGLESLCFHGISTNINNQGAVLSNLLQNPTSNLTTLELSDTNINPTGWQAIFASLETPACRLQKLTLDRSNIDDDVALSLFSILVDNSTLKELSCYDMIDVTDRGWQGFMAVITSPRSALTKLDICRNRIGDATKILLINDLAGNTKLEVLEIDEYGEHPSYGVLAAASRVLCNTSSIMHTYSSNHTLKALREYDYDDDDDGSDDDDNHRYRFAPGTMSLLVINRMCNSSQAAHVKIIMTHFSGDFDVQMFTGMDLSVLPHVIAWVGRYWDNDEATAVYDQLAQAEREEEDEDAHNGEVSIGTCEMSLLYHIVKSRAADMSDSL